MQTLSARNVKHARVEIGKADSPVAPGVEPFVQATAALDHLACLHAPVGGVDHEAEPGDTRRHGSGLGRTLVDGQAKGGESFDDRLLPLPELRLGVREQRHVVYVVQVPRAERDSGSANLGRVMADRPAGSPTRSEPPSWGVNLR
jgi:hypothetical protein